MKTFVGLSAFLTCLAINAAAHTIDYKVYNPSYDNVWIEFITQGFKHIIPLGLDHILFIVCIYFLNTSIKSILRQTTVFTIAHSVTLCLAANGYLVVPSNIVEPIIALSIAVLAIENILARKVKSYRLLLIFIFGLIHGMGFASALSELNLPDRDFAKALFSFNVGVELGQIAVVLGMYLLLHTYLKNKSWYRAGILIPTNILVAAVALYWTITRVI
jgi:hydrogenase/urease accessory protein HupE